MMPPHCTSSSLDDDGVPRACALEIGHDGDHLGWDASTWEDPCTVLARLTRAWPDHRFTCTDRTWIARHLTPGCPWPVESAPTPELLEESLREHHGEPASARP